MPRKLLYLLALALTLLSCQKTAPNLAPDQTVHFVYTDTDRIALNATRLKIIVLQNAALAANCLYIQGVGLNKNTGDMDDFIASIPVHQPAAAPCIVFSQDFPGYKNGFHDIAISKNEVTTIGLGGVISSFHQPDLSLIQHDKTTLPPMHTIAKEQDISLAWYQDQQGEPWLLFQIIKDRSTPEAATYKDSPSLFVAIHKYSSAISHWGKYPSAASRLLE